MSLTPEQLQVGTTYIGALDHNRGFGAHRTLIQIDPEARVVSLRNEVSTPPPNAYVLLGTMGLDEFAAWAESSLQEATTREGVIVRKGQIWRNLDKRMHNRHCRVEAVRDGKAVMVCCTEEGRVINSLREVRVAVARMHKSSTGWALVR